MVITIVRTRGEMAGAVAASEVRAARAGTRTGGSTVPLHTDRLTISLSPHRW